jgi:hypothetical protein
VEFEVLEISRQPNYHSFLGYMALSPLLPSTCAAASSLADSDEATIPQFIIILLWFKVMLWSLPCALAFLTFAPPLPLLLFALNLPRRLEADALSGMVSTVSLLPLLQEFHLFT